MRRRRLFCPWLTGLVILLPGATSAAELKINTLAAMFARLKSCWTPPAVPLSDPGMQITVLLSFTRDGNILGQPKITYESEYATNNDRLIYRTALAEALGRCTPMPFTNELGGAVAGRPLRIRFDARRTKSTEMKSWQTTITF